MTAHQVLFCPFCREPFEGRTTCPTHELELVPLDRIAPPPAPGADDEDDDDELAADPDDRPLSALDLRYGRGIVGLGGIVAAAALVAPAALLEGRTLRTHELAAALPSLWTLSLVSFSAIYLLLRRRTRRALRSLRLSVPLLGAAALLTFVRAALRLGRTLLDHPAGYLMVLSAVLLVAGGLRLGVGRRAQ